MQQHMALWKVILRVKKSLGQKRRVEAVELHSAHLLKIKSTQKNLDRPRPLPRKLL